MNGGSGTSTEGLRLRQLEQIAAEVDRVIEYAVTAQVSASRDPGAVAAVCADELARPRTLVRGYLGGA